MPLPAPTYSRKPLHERSIRVNSFERQDGLWDIEAELVDCKAYDFPKRNGTVHQAGTPFHHLLLRITINRDFTITDAMAVYDVAPFGGECSAIAPAYQDLIGMNLLKSFRQQVKSRFHRTAGCTHMSELAGVLPTVALQTMANQRRLNPDPDRRPFQLDGCYAQRLSGPVVKEHHPRWYIAPEVDEGMKSSSD